MAGTINIKKHCLVVDGIAYTGTKSTIVNMLCDYWFDNRVLYYQKKYTYPVRMSTYSDEFTIEELHKDAVQVLFDRFSKQYEHYIMYR